MNLLHLPDQPIPNNLAIDEALINWSDRLSDPVEVLRVWEAPEYAVVIGRSSKLAEEVRVHWCQSQSVPVFRRCSGGAAVVIGPGCLMYSLILSYELRPHLRMLDQAHSLVMGTLVAGFCDLQLDVRHQGTCDLTYQNRKFSGNSLRCKRRALLYHGTILYDFPLELITDSLYRPPREPEYRQHREHERFVANLPANFESLREMLCSQWSATQPLCDWPEQDAQTLLRERYTSDAWLNLR